jgi:hypothetical protein
MSVVRSGGLTLSDHFGRSATTADCAPVFLLIQAEYAEPSLDDINYLPLNVNCPIHDHGVSAFDNRLILIQRWL